MAQRRMFSKEIVQSDKFLSMPISARYLYFVLGMAADDEGFVGSPKKELRICGASEDDMNILLAKEYLKIFGSGVIVIVDWLINNNLRKDRCKETIYLKEKKEYLLSNKKVICDFSNSELASDNQMSTNMQPNDNQVATNGFPVGCVTKEDSIGKDNKVKEEDNGKFHKLPPLFLVSLDNAVKYAKQNANKLGTSPELAESAAVAWFKKNKDSWQILRNPEENFKSWIKRQMPSTNKKEQKKVKVTRTVFTRRNGTDKPVPVTYTDWVYENEVNGEQ